MTRNSRRDVAKMDSRRKLQHHAACYGKKIQTEHLKIEKLNKEISVAQEKVLNQQKKVGGNDKSCNVNAIMIEKQIKMLENRLNHQFVKLNQEAAHNRELRKKIDDLRSDRVIYDGIYKRFELELHEKEEEILEAIQLGLNASQEHDKATTELDNIKNLTKKNMDDLEKNKSELKLLYKQDHDREEEKRKINLFDSSTPKKKSILRRNSSSGNVTETKDSQVSFTEHRSEKKEVYHSATLLYKEDNRDHDVSKEIVQRKLPLSTRQLRKSECATKKSDAEEQTFSLFKYVSNSMNEEIMQLEEQIESCRKEFNRAKEVHNVDNERKKKILNLQEKKEKIDKKLRESERSYNAATEDLNELKKATQQVLHSSGLNQLYVEELLGKDGDADVNLLKCLGAIENQVIVLIEKFTIGTPGNGDVSCFSEILSPKQNKVPNSQSLEFPTVNDSDIDDDINKEDDRPLTRKELEQMINKRLG